MRTKQTNNKQMNRDIKIKIKIQKQNEGNAYTDVYYKFPTQKDTHRCHNK